MNVFSVIAINIAAFLLFWIVVFFIPHRISIAGIPKGFEEKTFKKRGS